MAKLRLGPRRAKRRRQQRQRHRRSLQAVRLGVPVFQAHPKKRNSQQRLPRLRKIPQTNRGQQEVADSSQKAVPRILPDNQAMGRTAKKHCQDLLAALARHPRVQVYSKVNPAWTQDEEDYWVPWYVDWCHRRPCREPLAAHCNDEHCLPEDQCLRLCDPLHEHELGYALDHSFREARTALPQQLRPLLLPLRS